MLGLGAYDSSDDEAGWEVTPGAPKRESNGPPAQAFQTIEYTNDQSSYLSVKQPSEKITAPEPDQPFLGPTHASSPMLQQLPANEQLPVFPASRTLIHDLTLPPVPNLDIPPSPPGSPDPAANAKISHFLSLKKQGMHFNEKLAGSASLRNPSLIRKMMDHAGIDDQAQYYTSLPLQIRGASDLPRWGFKEELLKAQREIQAEARKVLGHKDAVQFVAATPGESNLRGSASDLRAIQK
ncbi:hypothetical protein BO70DRAFT_363726 [Aspergillus heteromorphus CBS 117.55]|uniref:HCNGP-domain-containing protein n=1 Tax=Aspergillus heteromorphus CBS 117.55 TaxID=1448321 RepID=A0A317VTJ3_9EURO|nr:uncharacterized protein BO70DRAFT_363726 [Aspergillus heteromorphus CBS 117.55]PWY76168.1 hypothetical protein BO70DRAFT_363726 [Aspergillus heteromorphus CBS 117.55]